MPPVHDLTGRDASFVGPVALQFRAGHQKAECLRMSIKCDATPRPRAGTETGRETHCEGRNAHSRRSQRETTGRGSDSRRHRQIA
jgi:hypothetical protein